MNSSPSRSSDLIETLSSYLTGLDETGTSSVELQTPFPVHAPLPPPPRPRQQPAPVPPLDPPPVEKSILPPPPKPAPVARSVAEKLCWCTLIRMTACHDTLPAEESTVVLVTGTAECADNNGTLLQQILKAVGYEMLGKPLQLTHPADLSGAGSRILVMGNQALQVVSPAGMDLQIVRGMWQTTPYGKLISTYPPSALHDNPVGKKAVWQDLKNLLKDLGLAVPDWTRTKLSGK